MDTGQAVATDMFKRGSAEQIREVFERVSAADVTGALHNAGAVQGMQARVKGSRMVGRALTVWTYPGDWAKPVQAIDEASEGDVVVVDAGGRAPAVWGEMATKSCLQRGLSGIVIDGAIRDLANIREMGFPAFSTLVTPVAGEPRGQGMIGVPLRIGGQLIRTGDWIVGDDDGIVVVPQERAVEVANRAQAVVEYEEHTMAEIDEGRTLGQVGELERWEQLGKKSNEQEG
jgi:3-hexulose-6-phosphate synthase/6-phospho-3-hexuloisomerase